MNVLGILEGRGVLTCGDETAEAAYHITVRQRGDVREASGFIRASTPALFAALKHRQPILRLEDGGEIIVMPTQVDMASGAAEVLVSGPVPGF